MRLSQRSPWASRVRVRYSAASVEIDSALSHASRWVSVAERSRTLVAERGFQHLAGGLRLGHPVVGGGRVGVVGVST